MRPQTKTNEAGRYWLLSWLSARKAVSEAVATRVHCDASPETVWKRIIFYEEVPGRAPFLLRVLLPRPVRTEGDKSAVGGMVQCTYKAGDLVKRITAVEPPCLVKFEVIEQRLGIEGCVIALGGSYEIRQCGDGADVVLTTNYRAYLRPRGLWRPLERLLAGQLHTHILNGMRADVPHGAAAMRRAAMECLTRERNARGGLACTPSPSRSRP
jgi:hypothetical protein